MFAAVLSVRPDEREDGRVEGEEADKCREGFGGDDFGVGGRGDGGEVDAGERLHFIVSVVRRRRRVVVVGGSCRRRNSGFGSDDDIDVVELRREGVEIEGLVGAVEDDVDKVIANMPLLIHAVRIVLEVRGHHGGDVEDELGDTVTPGVRELAVHVGLPI